MTRDKKLQNVAEQAHLGQQTLAMEVFAWLHYNKKWWLAPVVLILMVFSLLVILSGTAVAPFIYTLF